MMSKNKNYPGHIEERAGIFRVHLSVAGHRHKFTLDEGTTREEAEAFARSKFDELRGRAARGLPGRMRFSELVSRYRQAQLPHLAPNSQRSYATSLDAFEQYFVTEGGDPPAHEIRRGHVKAFMAWRRVHRPDGTELTKPVSARTVAKDRVVLHVVFSFGEELEIIDGNPVTSTTAPKGDKREPLILDGDQYEELLEACDSKARPMLWLYVLTLGETGLRCDSEALWLRWEDVDLERGFLTVESVRKGRRTKSGKMRRVPMTRRLREAMRDHMAAYRLKTYHGQRTEWVFHHELDRRHAKAGTRLGRIHRAFASAVERAKLPSDLRQHDLRHRRVTTWLQEGKPMHLVQRAMGHSTIRVTEGYSHLVDNDLLGLVEEPDQELRKLTAEG